jgi:hypothetical protein
MAARNEWIGDGHIDVDIATDNETSADVDAIPCPWAGAHQKRGSCRCGRAGTITVPIDHDDFVTRDEIRCSDRACRIENRSRPKHFECRSSTRNAESLGHSLRYERHTLVRWRLDYDIDGGSTVTKS